MGPSCSGRRRRRKRNTRRKALFKKRLSKDQDNSIADSPVRPLGSGLPEEVDGSNDVINVDMSWDGFSGCSTPRGEKFRIPEVNTCPPAPKKRRTMRSCSLRRSPIAFFASPDIELFFYFALRGIPV